MGAATLAEGMLVSWQQQAVQTHQEVAWIQSQHSCGRDFSPARWPAKKLIIWTLAIQKKMEIIKSLRASWKPLLVASIFHQVGLFWKIRLISWPKNFTFCPDMPKNSTTMDSRGEYRFGHSSSSPNHSPTKESLKNSERWGFIDMGFEHNLFYFILIFIQEYTTVHHVRHAVPSSSEQFDSATTNLSPRRNFGGQIELCEN